MIKQLLLLAILGLTTDVMCLRAERGNLARTETVVDGEKSVMFEIRKNGEDTVVLLCQWNKADQANYIVYGAYVESGQTLSGCFCKLEEEFKARQKA